MADEETQTQPDRHGVDADAELRDIDGMPDDRADDLMSGMMNAIFGEGWSGADTSGKALAQQRRESMARIKRQANVFRDCFATPEGRKCLNLIIEQTIDAPPYPAEANLPLEAITALVIAHDAQCNFVRAILSAIAQADNLGAKETGT